MGFKILPLGIALAALCTAGAAFAQSENGGLPSLLCASHEVVQCTTPGGCTEVARVKVDVPAFMRVDFADNTVSDPAGTDDDVSTIDLIHLVDGQIVLHGTDPGGPGGSDGTAWTATIAEATGEMLVSTIGQGTVFLVIGNCLIEEGDRTFEGDETNDSSRLDLSPAPRSSLARTPPLPAGAKPAVKGAVDDPD